MWKALAKSDSATRSTEGIRVVSLGDIVDLIKEAEVITGKPGRVFFWSVDDGGRRQARMTFDGYVMSSIPSAFVVDPSDVLGLSRSSMVAAMFKGALFAEEI